MFETRAIQTEYLDDPRLDAAAAEESYRFMQHVNRRWGGTAAVCRFLKTQCPKGSSVKVLDLGSGSCDIPLSASSRLKKSGRHVEFTCLEVNPTALAIARRILHRCRTPQIHLVDQDIFAFEPAEPFDYAVGSMFFHHLSNDQIIALIKKLCGFVKHGVFINDLYRSGVNYYACKLAAAAADPVVRHDALLSIRRGFTENELRYLLGRLRPYRVTVRRYWFYRITATVLFNKERPQ